MPTTPLAGLPYPASSAAPNVPQDLQNLATAVDNTIPAVVANRTARDAITGNGRRVFQADTGLDLIKVGSAWRLASAQLYTNDGMLPSQSLTNISWQGADVYGWQPGLGSKIVLPADGVGRNCLVQAQVSIVRDGSFHIRGDFTSPTVTVYSHNVRSQSSGDERVTIQMAVFHTGAGTSTFYIEAKSAVSGASAADYLYPSLSILAS